MTSRLCGTRRHGLAQSTIEVPSKPSGSMRFRAEICVNLEHVYLEVVNKVVVVYNKGLRP